MAEESISEKEYRTEMRLQGFLGIDRSQGETDLDVRNAWNAENVETKGGMLSGGTGFVRAFPPLGAECRTLVRFPRRNRPDDPDVYAAAGGGGVYTYEQGASSWVQRGSGFSGNRWSCVTYEWERDGEREDVLLMSNAEDGMVLLAGRDLSLTRVQLSIGEEYADVRFSCLCRYAERIWGVGDAAHPDSIFYSRPYDPLDWTEDTEAPELGGGVIRQPTWDGQAFLSLMPCGSGLAALKAGGIFAIRGIDPSDFVITAVTGTDGPVCQESVSQDGGRLLYLARDGIGVYDGQSAGLLRRDALAGLLPRGITSACACAAQGVWYLAVPDGSGNGLSRIVEYDTERGTLLLRTGTAFSALYAVDGAVYLTCAEEPWNIVRFAGKGEEVPPAGGAASFWSTGRMTDGGRRMRHFSVRLTAEADGDSVPLEVSLETEEGKRTRTRILRKGRQELRLRFCLRGRSVRLTAGTPGAAHPWRIPGGILLSADAGEEP